VTLVAVKIRLVRVWRDGHRRHTRARGGITGLMRLPAALLAGVLLATSAPAFAAPEVNWDSRAWELKAGGLPPNALNERPEWADRQVSLDGRILWVVAVLPGGDSSWFDRKLQGSRQAESTLTAFADYLVRARYAADPVDYLHKQLVSMHHRLKAGFDREGYATVETHERPSAIWLRFGYPVDVVETALGFKLAPPPPPARPRHVTVRRDPNAPTAWDYVWEAAWAGGIILVATVAVLFAQATQK